MKNRRIYTVELPSVSKEFAQTLDKTFPAIVPKPGVTLDTLMYNAGIRVVVEHVLKHAVGTRTNINRTVKNET